MKTTTQVLNDVLAMKPAGDITLTTKDVERAASMAHRDALQWCAGLIEEVVEVRGSSGGAYGVLCDIQAKLRETDPNQKTFGI